MRLTSDFWVSALVRRINDTGAFAALSRRGAAEAGAIFLKLRNPDGTYDLFGPAPQMVYEETKPDERLFTRLKSAAAEMDVNDDLEKQKRWDSDLWIVEIEDYRGDRSELFSVVDL